MTIRFFAARSASIFIATTLAYSLLVSCRKPVDAIGKPEDIQPYSFNEIFDAFWLGMRNNYVFWDIDQRQTDWDGVYKRYKPLFERLNADNFEDVLTGVDYIKQITGQLTDGHLTITFNDSRLAGFFISPAKQKRLYKNPDSDISLGQLLYANPGRYFDDSYLRVTGPINLLTGRIGDSILYLFSDRFQLKEAYNDPLNDSIRNAVDFFLRARKGINIKKLVLDFRNNSGGNVDDLNFLVGCLVDHPLPFGSLTYKSGAGMLAYSPAIAATITPQVNSQVFNGRIRILTNSETHSMAELCTMALRALPNSMVIGDTTWGATGMIPAGYNNQLFTGGPFVAAKFINVYTPAASFHYLNGKSYEGIGFPPDKWVQHINNTSDVQLEAALRE